MGAVSGLALLETHDSTADRMSSRRHCVSPHSKGAMGSLRTRVILLGLASVGASFLAPPPAQTRQPVSAMRAVRMQAPAATEEKPQKSFVQTEMRSEQPAQRTHIARHRAVAPARGCTTWHTYRSGVVHRLRLPSQCTPAPHPFQEPALNASRACGQALR